MRLVARAFSSRRRHEAVERLARLGPGPLARLPVGPLAGGPRCATSPRLPRFAGISYAGGGTRTPDTRIMTGAPGVALPELRPVRSRWRSLGGVGFAESPANSAGSTTPAFATTRSSSNTTIVDAWTMRTTPWTRAAAGTNSHYQTRFKRSPHPPPRTRRWIEGLRKGSVGSSRYGDPSAVLSDTA
jgi:hypothetical protein